MKSMLVKLGNWSPPVHFLKAEVIEKTSVEVADHRTFRNETDFNPVVRQTKDCVFLNISVLRVHCFFIQNALH